MKKLVYLDNAATTPLSANAKKAMENYWDKEYGNPSSLYSLGRNNKKILKDAREEISKCINSSPSEIYFTSCGTESDNWAIKGTAFNFKRRGKHIIVSSIEHHAILNSCHFLETQGFSVTYLPVNDKSEIENNILENAIREDTILVSIMMVNNEIGTIQNIKELCNIAHSKNILFHTDAVQAIGHIPVDVRDLGVDMLSCSAHKFNGPKGIGFLFIKDNVKIAPLLNGGQQENNMRAGTENTPLIVGMAEALKEHVEGMEKNKFHIEKLRNLLIQQLYDNNFDFIINGSKNSAPGTISISFLNGEGEVILNRLDLLGICVSTGSACDSKNTNLSHVLKAINCPEQYAYGTIRISLSEYNTCDEINILIDALKKIFNK